MEMESESEEKKIRTSHILALGATSSFFRSPSIKNQGNARGASLRLPGGLRRSRSRRCRSATAGERRGDPLGRPPLGAVTMGGGVADTTVVVLLYPLLSEAIRAAASVIACFTSKLP